MVLIESNNCLLFYFPKCNTVFNYPKHNFGGNNTSRIDHMTQSYRGQALSGQENLFACKNNCLG